MKNQKIAMLCVYVMALLMACSTVDPTDTGPLEDALRTGSGATLQSIAYKDRVSEVCVSLVQALKNLGAFEAKPDYEARVPAVHCAPVGTPLDAHDKWVAFAFTKSEVMDLCSRWDGRGTVFRHAVDEMTRQANTLLGKASGSEWTCLSETEWETVWVKATHVVDSANPDPAWLEEETEQRRILQIEAIIAGLLGGYLIAADVAAAIPATESVFKQFPALCAQSTGHGECDPLSPYYVPSPDSGDAP